VSATIVLDPHAKILRQSDAIDHYQAWQAKQPKTGTRR